MRIPRYALIEDQSTFHVCWQCHNKNFLLKSDWAKRTYVELLTKFKTRYKVKIRNLCLMSNHFHLTGYCEKAKLLSDFFRVVNSLFARKFNKKHGRRGQVVMDRFKSPLIKTGEDLLNVMLYIDLNPKRAQMVKHPRDYPWSSYSFYAYGKANPLIDPPESYLSLGKTPEERQKRYRELVEEILRNDWKEKKPYSSVPFIGDPDWIKEKTEELKKKRRMLKVRWIENFRVQFGQSPPS